MKPTLRTALGWVAALLLNIGALTVIAGLVLPRAGGSGSAVLVTGVALCAAGLAVGAGWMFASRTPHR
ncbi:MAG TPA: hypothetical protein VGO99_04920 [Leifsonia sp.]|nr:hypothetical protein [Leifsonia sp.]